MKRSTQQTRSRIALALTAALLLAGSSLRSSNAAEPAVLEQIPDDAAAVLVITNVKAFSTRLANLGVRMNLPIPPDPMGIALRNLRIAKGFDANNSAAVALLKPLEPAPDAPPADAAPGPQAVILLPTTDSKTMLEQWEPGDPDKDGISEISLPTGRMTRGFVATAGNYVAFAQDHDVLARFLAKKQPLSKTLPADAAQAMEKNDIVFYANVPAFSKSALDALEKKQEELAGMMDLMNLQAANETSAALQKEQFNLMCQGAKMYLKQANMGLLTLRLTDAGVTLGTSSQFQQDTTLGKFVAAQKPANAPSLVGLPDSSFAAAGAMVLEPKSFSQAIGDVLDQVLSDPVIAKDPRIDELKKAVELTRQSAALTQGGNFVFYVVPDDPQKGRFDGTWVIDTTDAKKYLALQMELAKNPLSTETMDPNFTSTVTVTPDAITVKGVKFAKIVHKIQLREETPNHPLPPTARKSLDLITSLYGTQGIVLYLGSIDNKIIAIMGSDAVTIDSVVDAVQKKSNLLASSKLIAQDKDQIVANPVFVTYLSIEPWLIMAQNVALGALGQPQMPPPPAGPDTAPSAPVALSVGITGTTVTSEIHLPVSALSNVAKWAMNLQALFAGQNALPPTPEPAPEPPQVPEK